MTDFMINAFSLESVSIKDKYCLNAFEKEVEYLVQFDVDKLLAGFRETAGIDTKGAERYPGWENMLIGGHSVGHYVGAAANCLKSPDCNQNNREKLVEILTQLLDGFEECQKVLGNGFLFGAHIADKNNVEVQFDNVEKNLTHIITQAWVPWYTMHKIIEGLLCVADLKSYEKLSSKAMTILFSLTDWIFNRVNRWDENTHKTVLSIEYGGMNDCLYSYYIRSGNEKALVCAKAFDDVPLFSRISSAETGENVLSGRHANTTIPKFIGAANRYVVTGEKEFLQYAENFWKLVTNAHTYVNGGNSTWEHFGEDNNLYSKLSNCNCETCNSYNMLKLTKLLYMLTGKKIYADWYEHTFINSILSSQNPETGMTTYFQPMASGYFKVYSTPFSSFWCCTGTGMENFSKLGESFYYTKDDGIIVNQYISSELQLKENNFKLIQEASIPENNFVSFHFEGKFSGKISFRLPEWLCSDAEIQVNSSVCKYEIKNDYIVVSGDFDSSVEIKIVLPMEIKVFNLPDQKDAYAFKYGPVVLCGLLGNADGKTATNGVNVQVPEKAVIDEDFIPSKTDIITVKGMSSGEFISRINDYLVRDESKEYLCFTLKNTDANLQYVEHYRQYKQRYGVYFRFLDEEASKNFMEDKLSQGYINANKLDTVQPGYGQYENDELHNMTEYGNGSAGQTYHGTSRYAKEGGQFSYRMIVDKKGTDLLVQFNPVDNGKSVKIMAGESVLFEERLDCKDLTGFNKVRIPLPAEVMEKNTEEVVYEGKKYTVMKFTISGSNGEKSAQICEFMYTLKA